MNGRMPEILAPAGTMDALKAAVNCGANAVYLGASRFSARAYAGNFDEDELRHAVEYCHERGVAVHMALNTLLLSQGEVDAALKQAVDAARTGVDAFIVQDLSLASVLRQSLPEMPLHASTQLSVTDRYGAGLMKRLGFARVVVGREVSREELKPIIAEGLPMEVFIHGALCMSVSGQCYLSAALGGRSGNRGRCAGACRLPFENYCLSLKDLSHISHARELADMGVVSFKIEGRMRRPEYVAAAVTAVRCALSGQPFDEELLAAAFSRSGLTDGYYTGRRGREMFGVRGKEDVLSMEQALPKLRPLCEKPSVTVPVDMSVTVRPGMGARLIVSDGVRTASSLGPIPEPAITSSISAQEIWASLEKTGDTPYRLRALRTNITPGLFLSKASVNAMRRDALAELSAQRIQRPAPVVRPFLLPAPEKRSGGAGKWLLSASTAEQISTVDRSAFDLVALPVAQWEQAPVDWRSAVALPRAQFGDPQELREQLEQARRAGIRMALCSNPGAVALARELGFRVWGDFSLYCTNPLTARELNRLGVELVTLSPETDTAECLEQIPASVQAGVMVYGRLPLMVTRNCPVRQTDHYRGCGDNKDCYILDRKGIAMPVQCGGGVSHVLNPRPLWLADRLKDYGAADFLTVSLTTETPKEAAGLIARIRAGEPAPMAFTRGFSAGITQWEQSEGQQRSRKSRE